MERGNDEMTKYAALQLFFEGFECPVYEQSTVPDEKEIDEYPYITYEAGTDSFGGEVALTFSIWDKGTSWLMANALAEEISAVIGRGGRLIECDDGAMWIKRGSPFAQHLTDEDDMIRRIVCNITIEYFMED